MCWKKLSKMLADNKKLIQSKISLRKMTPIDKAKSIYENADIKKMLDSGRQQLGKKGQFLRDYTDKIKQIVEEKGKDLKDKSQKLKDSVPDLSNKFNLFEASDKLKQKFIEYGSTLKKPQKQKQSINDLPKIQETKKKQQSRYKFSGTKLAQSIFEKSRGGHQQFFANMAVKNTKSIFSKIFSNLYWRILFAICLVAIIYVSPQLIREIGDLSLKNKRLERQITKEQAK